METYLVGGAVRDRLLGRPVTERDWVVVGATPEQMRAQGFCQIGRDFPVFLHPETHEEYALARTERKTGAGYHGFAVHAAPDVTLEQDLLRRDLTINALAQPADQLPDGEIVDPFNGQADLKAKVLRHISPAFAEDPVRVLRIARFAARYAALGFTVAPETNALMQRMVASGEVDALVPERVWQETQKALTEQSPRAFVEVLRDCGALARIFPEIDVLFGVPQPPQYHPEIDTGEHVLLALEVAVELSDDPVVRFAVLMHDLGKGVTPKQFWPSHRGHEEAGVKVIDALCDRLRVPNDYRKLARQVSRYHLHAHRIDELRPATVLKVLEGLNAFRQPQNVDRFLLACEADARGRAGLQDGHYSQAKKMRAACSAAREVQPSELGLEEFTGPQSGAQIAARIRESRIKAIAKALF